MASRRAADALIAGGAVLVNGQLPPAAGQLVEPGVDRVTLRGDEVAPPSAQARHHILLHKPVGVIVTAHDPEGRQTVFDLIGEETGARRLFSVGRLDMDSSGLLLLTDDGDLAQRLAHPRHGLSKEYLVTVSGVPEEAALRRLRQGVSLDGRPVRALQVEVLQQQGRLASLRVVVAEGRNRQVRRMLEGVGHTVVDLRREAFGPIRLGRLKVGAWRHLRPAEVAALQSQSGVRVKS